MQHILATIQLLSSLHQGCEQHLNNTVMRSSTLLFSVQISKTWLHQSEDQSWEIFGDAHSGCMSTDTHGGWGADCKVAPSNCLNFLSLLSAFQHSTISQCAERGQRDQDDPGKERTSRNETVFTHIFYLFLYSLNTVVLLHRTH